MLETMEIIEKELKEGRDYVNIGGERYRPGDCFLQNGREITVKKITDAAHFLDDRYSCWNTYMFYDYKCEHCPERNKDKKTQDRTPAAIVADNAETERDTFRNEMVQNKGLQVYEAYSKIHFYEKMCWHLVNCGREPSEKNSEEILKHGKKTPIANMYRYFVYRTSYEAESVSTKVDRERFISNYIADQNNQQY